MSRHGAFLDRLRAAGVPDPAGDLRRLTDWAFAGLDDTAPEGMARLEEAVTRRVAREPVSKIKGLRAFWKHEFEVTRDTLDPRPDTESLVEQALAAPFSRVLDLGTGTGCIAISLLSERPDAAGVATDTSDAALAVAARNAARIGVGDRLKLVRADWFDGVDDRFDLVVSNPPYITQAEMAELDPEVAQFDPAEALTPGGDGLHAYRAIAAGAPGHLAAGGRLLLEIGWKQSDAVREIVAGAGFLDIVCHRDLGGRDRVISAVRR